jgi:hypothetical protein
MLALVVCQFRDRHEIDEGLALVAKCFLKKQMVPGFAGAGY